MARPAEVVDRPGEHSEERAAIVVVPEDRNLPCSARRHVEEPVGKEVARKPRHARSKLDVNLPKALSIRTS